MLEMISISVVWFHSTIRLCWWCNVARQQCSDY